MAKRSDIRLSNVLPKRQKVRPLPRLVAKIGRNEPCPCASGKKYKDCHEAAGEAFLSRLAMEREKANGQADGNGSWFRRLLTRLGRP